jgi:Tol biopolymer transport system component
MAGLAGLDGVMIFKRLRRLFVVAVLGLAVSAAIAGCASGSGGTGGPTPTPTPIPTPTPTPNPAPTVTTLSPNSATTGGLAFTLTVRGSNFVSVSTVQWNGNSRTTTFVSSTQLQAHIMAADLATKGTVAITVINPAPGGGTSNGVNFTIPADTITFQSRRALDGSDAANLVFDVWTNNPDGSNPVPLTKLIVASSFDPTYARDGSKIAFSSLRALNGSDSNNTNFTSNIWVMNADGSSPVPLTKLTAAGSIIPVWSPDGSKIAFLSPRALDGSDSINTNPTSNVWVMNADGSGQTPLTRLTATSAFSFAPVWSPDGSKIAFESSRALDGSDSANTNQTFNIWVMNADGSGQTPLTRLTATSAISLTPVWSPDGSKIAYVSARALEGSDFATLNSTQNIWVTNADGSNQAPLTKLATGGANAAAPIWSPGGDKIFFNSQRLLNGSDTSSIVNNIWVVSADGSSRAPLTNLTKFGADSISPRQP